MLLETLDDQKTEKLELPPGAACWYLYQASQKHHGNGCSAWHPTLTKADSSILERVQKSALNIILGSGYTSYESAPDILELDTDTLEERRDELCLNFARKSAEHPIHSKWFLKTKGEQHTRNHNIYQPVWARTGRFGKSPIPHMTNILNEHCRKKKWKTESSLVMYICMHSLVTMDHKCGCLWASIIVHQFYVSLYFITLYH